MKYTKNNIKQFLHDAKAVSPAIATLILIVIAAVAAAGVGILVQSSQKNAQDQTGNKNLDVVGTIDIKGSTTVLPVTQLAAEDFMKKYPAVTISVAGGGSQTGQLDIYTKTVDIGASSSKWDVNPFTLNGITVPARKDAIIQEAGPDATVWETAIGTGMIVVAGNVPGVTTINVNNATGNTSQIAGTVMNITDADLITAYTTGTVTVSGVALKAVQRSDPSGTEETFAKWIGLTDANSQLSSPASVVGHQGNQGVRDAIAATANTIGFVDIGFAKGGVNGNDKVIPATMGGFAASSDNKGVGGKYDTASKITTTGKGLARDLFYYSQGVPTGVVKAYLDYMLTPDGQKSVHDAGFFSV